MPEQLVCTPKRLPRDKWQSAEKIATEINPVNHPPVEGLVRVVAGFRAKAKPKPKPTPKSKVKHRSGRKKMTGTVG